MNNNTWNDVVRAATRQGFALAGMGGHTLRRKEGDFEIENLGDGVRVRATKLNFSVIMAYWDATSWVGRNDWGTG